MSLLYSLLVLVYVILFFKNANTSAESLCYNLAESASAYVDWGLSPNKYNYV